MITLTTLTLGEILKKAGLNTLLGMGVVFTVLILISLLIYSMRFIPVIMDKVKNSGKTKKVPETVSQTNAVVAEAAAPPLAAEETDLALIAVITAAIAAATDTPADGIVIRSIRRSAKNNRKRA